jgi:FkbM family methyltransferase
MELHKAGVLGNAAKSVIGRLSSVISALHLDPLLLYAEIGTEMLRGKGSGTGWDLDAEVRSAAAFVKRPDPVLLDVGANYGQWSIAMRTLFPAAQKIVLFEPQPQCLKILEELNLPGKIVVPYAVSDCAMTHDFYLGPEGWPAASMYERGETYFREIQQQRVTIPVTTLDAVLSHYNIDFVDFAKFDIEGAEFSAFQGGKAAFSEGKIGALSLEFGSGNINSRTFFRDFWEFLTHHRYEIFRILPGGRAMPVPHYYEDLEHFRGVSNYLARLRHRSNV